LPDELWGVVVPELLLPLVPPGVSAPPVAEPPPDSPKYEKTLWRQLGWFRSVLASKFGADSNLLVSPANTNVGVWVLVVAVADAPADGLNSIQGTATCLPAASELEDAPPTLLDVAPGVVLVVPGVVVPLVVAPVLPLSEITANSSRPEVGLTIVSLMVAISLPDELVI